MKPMIFLLMLLQAAPAAAPADWPGMKLVYANDFEKTEEGKAPEDMLVLAGDFAVHASPEGRVLQLPGTPLQSFGVLVGPEDTGLSAIAARIRAEVTGRRSPEFGVGLGGGGGYRLWVMPAVNELQLIKGEDQVITAVPFKWNSGSWTELRLQIRPAGEGKWLVEGKAWPRGQAEPEKWMISATETEKLPTGRASIWGTPYSEKSILFDDVALYAPNQP